MTQTKYFHYARVCPECQDRCASCGRELRVIPNIRKIKERAAERRKDPELQAVIEDYTLVTIRAKARALASRAQITEDCALSRIRRALDALKREHKAKQVKTLDNPSPSMVDSTSAITPPNQEFYD